MIGICQFTSQKTRDPLSYGLLTPTNLQGIGKHLFVSHRQKELSDMSKLLVPPRKADLSRER
jgi:hypothetical protein